MIQFIIFIVGCLILTFFLIGVMKYIGAILGLGITLGWIVTGALSLLLKVPFVIENGGYFWLGSAVVFMLLLQFTPATRRFLISCFKIQTHGSANFAGEHIVKEYTTKKGLPMGITESGKKFRVMTHALTCAPTRSGKGVSAIIPFLLEHPGSVIVNDIKGENYAVTHRQREALGSHVFLIDPFGITGGRKNRFNWLDMIDVNNPDCVGQASSLADMLVANEKSAADPHFDDSAKTLLQGLILLAAADPDASVRNIVSVRKMITLPENDFLALMQGAIGHPAAFEVISRCASKIVGTPERERGSIISTAQRHTAFLDDPRIAETLSGSDFDLSRIKQDNMSVYLVFPGDKIRPYRSFIRGFFGLAMSAVTATQQRPSENIVFVYDEFGQLGYMADVEDKISIIASYGAFFWIFVQDLSQLKNIYHKWQTFFANATRQFFGCNDFDTAKYISDSLGQYTEKVDRLNTGAQSDSFIARNLMNPDEVMRLRKELCIVFVQGEPPALLKKIEYYTDKDYRGKFDDNPFITNN